jgi:hypothetical protein
MKQFRASVTSANSNGHGKGSSSTGARAKIERLLAHHEQITAALRTTLGLLDEGAHETKQQRGSTVLADALALDAARRGKRGPYGKRKPSAEARRQSKTDRREQRQRSANFLKLFDTDKPKRVPNSRGIAPLLLHGYLKRKGDGYVRTAREFSVEKS